ncbi:MAG: hypothetical protein KA113_16125 [Syntrophaceae bacterium]|nr:hypothetical protein [Syntrophaceae bacterium]
MIAKAKKLDSKASISKKKAAQIIRQHLIQEISKDFEIYDGVPCGIKYYNMSKEPCWTVLCSSGISGVGPDRMICVSKKTGKVIYDGLTVGE